MSATPAASPRIRILLLVTALLLFAIQGLALDYIVDDAFISFRYADNLVHDHGLTYNPQGPRVEGYTNLLWTLMIAGAIAVGINPAATAMLAGLLSGLAVLVITERWGRSMGLGSMAGIAVLLLAVNPAMVTWSVAGLETSLFTLLVLLGVRLAVASSTPAWLPGFALAVACLTRPEGLLMVALLALGLLLARGTRELRRLAPTWWIVVSTVALHTLWRRLYYHAWLPNTFYAKTGDLGAQLSTGWAYVYDVLAAFAGGPVFVLILVLAWKRRDAAITVASVLTLGWLTYVLVVGGDGLPMYRFAVPVLPFLALLIAAAIERTLTHRRGAALVAAGAAIVLTIVPGLHGPAAEYRELDRRYFVPKVVLVGKSLRQLVGDEASIALLPAGAIPYYSRLQSIDMLALNDPVVARKDIDFEGRLPGHWKHDAAEVLRQQPDYVLLGNIDVTPLPRSDGIPPLFPVERDLVQIPSFRRDYELVSWQLPNGSWLNAYRRRALSGS